MASRIKISQAGLSAGVAGVARTDGLDTGALVTLEDVSGTGNSTFHLLWGPPEDTTAKSSLAATGDPDIWTFSPTAAVYGSYLIELRDNGVPIERRIFGIRTPANQLLIPALNERASRHAGWDDDGADEIEASENNANDFPLSVLNSFRYAGWWRSLYELYRVVEFGIGSIADHALSLVKLVTVPEKSVLANPSNATGDVSTVGGSAALQYLRVNAANNGLEMATLAAHASDSVLYDAGTNTLQRAPISGCVVLAQNSNSASFHALTQTTAQSQTNSTANVTAGTLSVAANSVAVGSQFEVDALLRTLRGTTATAADLVIELLFGGVVIRTLTLATTTGNGNAGGVRVRGVITVRSTGSSGSAVITLSGLESVTQGGSVPNDTAPHFVSNPAFNQNTTATTIDTTVANTIELRARMSAAVANLTVTLLDCIIKRAA